MSLLFLNAVTENMRLKFYAKKTTHSGVVLHLKIE